MPLFCYEPIAFHKTRRRMFRMLKTRNRLLCMNDARPKGSNVDARSAMNLAGYRDGGFDRGAPAWKEGLWLLLGGLLFGPSWMKAYRLKAALLRAFVAPRPAPE